MVTKLPCIARTLSRSLSSVRPTRSTTENCYVDPTVELQKYLQSPLFGENEKTFCPSLVDIKEAEKLFREDPRNEIKFLGSVVDFEKCPKTGLPEVIFIGESNVGKSSLLKAIFKDSKKELVKTSKKPGHTKTLNFFKMGKKMVLVDVPGYGFRQPKHYIHSVETYLKKRSSLQRTFLITDGHTGLSDWDITALEMLEEFKIPYALVMTKIDLASTSERLVALTNLQNIRDRYASTYCFPQPFLVSSRTHEGLGYLQCFIAYITFNIKVKGG